MAIANPVVAWSAWSLVPWTYIPHYLDSALDWLGETGSTPTEWRKVYVRYKYAASSDPRDDQVMTFDISNITGGAIDATWTTTDYTTVEGYLNTFVTALSSNQTSGISCVEFKWYKASFNDYSSSKPFAPHGAPERVTPKSIAGAATTAQLPAQASATITWRTNYPRNWGRNYIPGLSTNMVSTGIPLIPNSTVDAIATAAQTFQVNLHSSQFQLVVPITSLGVGKRGEPGAGTPNRRLSAITKVQVDNIPDVIRRRRIHTATYKKVLP